MTTPIAEHVLSNSALEEMSQQTSLTPPILPKHLKPRLEDKSLEDLAKEIVHLTNEPEMKCMVKLDHKLTAITRAYVHVDIGRPTPEHTRIIAEPLTSDEQQHICSRYAAIAEEVIKDIPKATARELRLIPSFYTTLCETNKEKLEAIKRKGKG